MPRIVFRRSRARWPMRSPANPTDRPIRDRLASIGARDARGWARGSSRAAWANPGWRRSCGKPCRRSSARALCRWETSSGNVTPRPFPGTECRSVEGNRVPGGREVSLSLTCQVYKQISAPKISWILAYQLNSFVHIILDRNKNQGFTNDLEMINLMTRDEIIRPSRFVIIVLFMCLFFLFSQNKPHLVEPIDFENFILKNKTLLQNDPQRELLLYPQDDISVSYQAVVLLIYKLHPFHL